MKVQLSEIIRVHYGKALKADERDESGPHSVFGSAGQVGRHNEFLCDYPTVIIGRKGSVGAITWAPAKSWTIDTAYYVEVIDSTSVDLRYLFYALKNANLAQHTITTSIPGINRDTIYRAEVLLPRLEEQRRIAEVLDRADALRQKRCLALQKLDTLLESVFLDMFGDPVTNPKGWKALPISKIADLENGDRSSNYPSGPDIVDEGILFLSTKNIDIDRLVLDYRQFITEKKFASLSRGKLKRHDIAITLRGTLGSCAVFDCEFETGFINAQLLIIRPHGVDPLYLHKVLSAKSMRDHFSRIATGVAVKQLTARQVGELVIPIPPMPLQRKHSQVLVSMERQRKRQKRHSSELDMLFASLQSRAFEGEL